MNFKKSDTEHLQNNLLKIDKLLENCNSDFAKESVEFQGELDLAVMEKRVTIIDYENMSEQNIENTTLFSKNCKCQKK